MCYELCVVYVCGLCVCLSADEKISAVHCDLCVWSLSLCVWSVCLCVQSMIVWSVCLSEISAMHQELCVVCGVSLSVWSMCVVCVYVCL